MLRWMQPPLFLEKLKLKTNSKFIYVKILFPFPDHFTPLLSFNEILKGRLLIQHFSGGTPCKS